MSRLFCSFGGFLVALNVCCLGSQLVYLGPPWVLSLHLILLFTILSLSLILISTYFREVILLLEATEECPLAC